MTPGDRSSLPQTSDARDAAINLREQSVKLCALYHERIRAQLVGGFVSLFGRAGYVDASFGASVQVEGPSRIRDLGHDGGNLGERIYADGFEDAL